MADVARLLVEIDSAGAVRNATVLDRHLRRIDKSAAGAAASTSLIGGAAKTATVGLKGLLAAAGPLLALFSAFTIARGAIGTVADFEEQISRLQAITKASAADLQGLESVARELGASTRYSAVQAGKGLEFLALAGFSVDQSITALPATLNLATVGAIDLGAAADYASNILGQFQLAADQTGRVVDVLTATSQRSNTSVQQLADAMSFVGTVSGAAGISIEETAAALGVLGDRGIQGARGGTNLRMVILQLLDPTKKARQEFERLGVALEDVNPTSHSLFEIFSRLHKSGLDLASANKIFSSRTSAAALTLAQMSSRVKELNENNLKAKGTSQDFADTLNNTLKGSVYSLISAAQELYLQVGDAGLLGAMRKVVDFSTQVLRALGGQQTEYQKLNDVIDYTIAAIYEFPEATRFGIVESHDIIKGFVSEVLSEFNSVFTGLKVLGKMLLDDVGGVADSFFGVLKYAANRTIAVARAVYNALYVAAIITKDLMQGVMESFSLAAANEFAKASDKMRETLTNFSKGQDQVAWIFKKGIDYGWDHDFIGDGLEAGKEYAELFKIGLESILSGDFDFAKRIRERVATVRAERDRIAADAEAQRKARESSSGISTSPTEDASPTDAGMSREDFIAKSKTLQSLEAEVKLIGLSSDARERAKQLTDLQTEAEEAFGSQLADNDPIILQFLQRLDQIKSAERLQETADAIGDSFGKAFEDIITGTKDVQTAFAEMVQSIMREVVQQTITQPIASGISSFITGFASNLGGKATESSTAQAHGSRYGNAYSGGHLIPFKDGGIFSSPMTFPMYGGRTGVMGEAGPEAVMPLGRDEQGRLGVRSQGSSGTTINVYARDADSFRRSKRQIAQAMKQGNA